MKKIRQIAHVQKYARLNDSDFVNGPEIIAECNIRRVL